MKDHKSDSNSNGSRTVNELMAKATAAKKLSDAARRHLKMLKAEHKQARKAFKQAKKAAKKQSRKQKPQSNWRREKRAESPSKKLRQPLVKA